MTFTQTVSGCDEVVCSQKVLVNPGMGHAITSHKIDFLKSSFGASTIVNTGVGIIVVSNAMNSTCNNTSESVQHGPSIGMCELIHSGSTVFVARIDFVFLAQFDRYAT